MRKYMISAILAVCLGILSGCGGKGDGAGEIKSQSYSREAEPGTSRSQETEAGTSRSQEAEAGTSHSQEAEAGTSRSREAEAGEFGSEEPVITQVDWSGYFEGLTGTAVVYDTGKREYLIYNRKLADERHSPCSTFKIISALTGLENGIIIPEDSARIWSREIFWNEDWNRDIDFAEAFRTSCVWYFRQLIDDIGKEAMAAELDRLEYGNQDISDWEGQFNTNNNNRALTGFWIESSLKISPLEQVQVMERIFGPESRYKPETVEQLKQVMKVEDYETAMPVYGKTGMGKAGGKTVDAWFTGFAEGEEGPVYFCVRLGESEKKEATSARAKEIAMEILSDEY